MRGRNKAVASSASVLSSGVSPVRTRHPDILPPEAPSAARMPSGTSHPDILPSDPKAFGELRGRDATKDAVMSFFAPMPGMPPLSRPTPPAPAAGNAEEKDDDERPQNQNAAGLKTRRWANEALYLLRYAAKNLDIEERAFKGVRTSKNSSLSDLAAASEKVLARVMKVPKLPLVKLLDEELEKTGALKPSFRQAVFAAAWRLSRIDGPHSGINRIPA